MPTYIRFADAISAWVAKAFAWCLMVMTLGVTYEVVVRYVVKRPTVWAFDMSYMMYGTMFMLAGAYTLVARRACARRHHLPASEAARPGGSGAGSLFHLLLPRASWRWCSPARNTQSRSWGYHEVSINSPAGMPVYQFKTVIAVAGVLLVIQGIAQVMRCIICLRTGEWPAPPRDVEELEKQLLEQKSLERLQHGAEDIDVVDAGSAEPERRSGPMSGAEVALLQLGILVFAIMLGFPVAYTLMALGVGLRLLRLLRRRRSSSASLRVSPARIRARSEASGPISGRFSPTASSTSSSTRPTRSCRTTC